MIKAIEARELTIATLKEEQEKAHVIVVDALNTVFNYCIKHAAMDGDMETSIYPLKIASVQNLSVIAKKYFLSEVRDELKNAGYNISYDQAKEVLHIRW